MLRSKVGDNVCVFNESEEYILELTSVDRRKASGTVLSKTQSIKKNYPLTLFFSPIKRAQTEIIIQKCTEIGITKFQPVIMERTQFKTFNIDRLKLIAIEAVEQSNQISIPQINVPIHFEDFIKKNSFDLGVAFDGDGDRIGIIDNKGNLVYSDMIFLLLALDLQKEKKDITKRK